MNINDRYKQLTNGKQNKLNISPTAFFPTPNEKDYKKGYINRYFCQRTNDSNSPIYEIDVNGFRKLQSSVMYHTTNLKWRLTGPLTEQKIGAGEIVDKGIKESNKTSIRLASENIHKLGLYLPNTKQFHK